MLAVSLKQQFTGDEWRDVGMLVMFALIAGKKWAQISTGRPFADCGALAVVVAAATTAGCQLNNLLTLN